MTARRVLPALLLLFVGSGCAALIYEIVWFQLLQLVIGSSAVSLGVLLGTFMGGMCLGSLLLPRLISRAPASAARLRAARARHRRARPAAAVRRCRSSAASTPRGRGDGIAGIVLRALVAGICLLPPTLLMGATLPAISRWVETTPRRRVVARLLLRRQHRRRRARQPARRLLPAARATTWRSRPTSPSRSTSSSPRSALRASRRPTPYDAGAVDGAAAPSARAGAAAVYVAIALSGMTALGGRSDLDAAAVAALRRDGLHVLADPRGVPGRPRHRQQRRLGASARGIARPRRRARLVPAAAVRRDRVGGATC